MTEETKPVDATAEAVAAHLAAQDARIEALEGLTTEQHDRLGKLEGIVAKLLSAPKAKGGAVDAGALSKLGNAVYALQSHALPLEKDESLRDL